MAPDDDPRVYPTRPWIGVGAIVLRQDHVLMIRRGKPPASGEWSLPGGSLELGETYAAAAVREVWEETGVRVEAGALLTVIDRIDRDEKGAVRFHYLLVDVIAHYKSGEPVAGDDALDAAWIPLNALDDYDIWSETRRVIRLAASKG